MYGSKSYDFIMFLFMASNYPKAKKSAKINGKYFLQRTSLGKIHLICIKIQLLHFFHTVNLYSILLELESMGKPRTCSTRIGSQEHRKAASLEKQVQTAGSVQMLRRTLDKR